MSAANHHQEPITLADAAAAAAHQRLAPPGEPQWSPNYTFVLPFERNFQHQYTQDWMRNYWHSSLVVVAIYLVTIFAGQRLMSQRPAFKLKRVLTVWNICLALFSTFGTLRTMPELLHVLQHFGFKHSVCHPSFILSVKPAGYWTWLFSLSKVPELGDTLFIVLRKQPLIFLHWYHHITVLLFTWFTYSEYTASARWFVDMNYAVHSLMYTYYALKSLAKFRIPRFISMVITTAQILQMLMGAYVIWYAYYRKLQGDQCNITHASAAFGLAMYLSYFILFARFFSRVYLFRPGGATRAGAADQQAVSRKQE